jgi:hypothetical protein
MEKLLNILKKKLKNIKKKIFLYLPIKFNLLLLGEMYMINMLGITPIMIKRH